MNWFLYTIIWQAVLTVVPSLIIILIFKLINKNKKEEACNKEE